MLVEEYHMWAQTSEPDSDREEYAPGGYPIGKETGTYVRPIEPAMRETVEAQLASARQHLDDSIKLVRAEFSGQIDLIRRDITELQSDRQKRHQRGWDINKIIFNVTGYIVASGIGALIMWLLTGRGSK